jgi:hypothetical protein
LDYRRVIEEGKFWLDRIEALEELLVECTEGLIARGGHGELVAHQPSARRGAPHSTSLSAPKGPQDRD